MVRTIDVGQAEDVDEARDQLDPYVLPSERLLWWGRPDPTKHFAPADAFIIPFSLLWCGFSIFWEVGAARSGATLPFVLFGAPFVAVGLFFVFGRFIAKARRKRQTAYGLTDRRALVAVGTGSLSESPVQYQPVNMQRSRDGSHVSVTFGRSAMGRRGGPSYANTGLEFFARGDLPVGFYDVRDVAALERALQQARG